MLDSEIVNTLQRFARKITSFVSGDDKKDKIEKRASRNEVRLDPRAVRDFMLFYGR